MKTPQIVLASSSKYRQNLLKRLFNDVKCVKPEVDERSISEPHPESLAIKLAKLKADDVAKKLNAESEQLVIGSDQVAWCDDTLLHKPGNFERNCEQLRFCSGKEVHFYTALSIINTKTNEHFSDCDLTKVRFRKLSDNQIERYVKREPSYDCAGGFKVEGIGIALFEHIETRDPNALIGLPLIDLCTLLKNYGLDAL